MSMVGILRHNLGALGYDVDHILSYEINTYNEFADEETTIWELKHSVYGKHVRIVIDVNGNKSVIGKKGNPLHVKYNDRLVQWLFLGNAARVHGWKTVNYISTGMPYGREDKFPDAGLKETAKRSSASAHFFLDIVKQLLAPDYYVTMDAHNPAIFKWNENTKCVNLYTWWAVQKAVQLIGRPNVLLAPTDQWGDKKVEAISHDLWLDYINVIKRRSKKENNVVDDIIVVGDITGRDILIHDDILDTGGTFEILVRKLWELGKPKSISAVITAWLFNSWAIEKLTTLHNEWLMTTLYITNAVYRESYPDFVVVLDAAPNFAEVIEAAFVGRSINFNKWATT